MQRKSIINRITVRWPQSSCCGAALRFDDANHFWRCAQCGRRTNTTTEHPAQTLRRDRPTITLYHGDNGNHEFYETEGTIKVLIIRHQRSDPTAWFVLECWIDNTARPVNRMFGPLSAIVRNIAECCGVNVAIDPHREWTGETPMTLTDAA